MHSGDHPQFWSLAKSSQSDPKSPKKCVLRNKPSHFSASASLFKFTAQTPLEGETLSVPPLFLSRMLSDSPLQPHFPIEKLTKMPPAPRPVGPRAASLNPGSCSRENSSFGSWFYIFHHNNSKFTHRAKQGIDIMPSILLPLTIFLPMRSRQTKVFV